MSSPRTAKVRRLSSSHDCKVENADENVISIKTEPDVTSIKTEPNVISIKTEPNVISIKTEPNVISIKTEPNVYSWVELTYDDLTIIFKNLNAKDLRNAAQVCKLWSEIADVEKRLRNTSPVTLLGRVKNSWDDLSPDRQLIDNVRVKPILSMIFTRTLDEKHPLTGQSNVDCPCKILPIGCTHITVGNHGIIKDQFESKSAHNAAYMLLPQDNDIRIDTIYEARYPSESTDFPENLPVTKCALKKLKYYRSFRKVKCFIILSNDDFENSFPLLEFLPRTKTTSGCVATDLLLCKKNRFERFCSRSMAWITILISGRDVCTWSAILEAECNTEPKVEAKLTKLRDLVRLKKKSICFMFACDGRGENMFRNPNVESTIFKKLFPKVPLIGCFGGGEYGNCSIDEIENRDHEFSTVFMIVTYGNS